MLEMSPLNFIILSCNKDSINRLSLKIKIRSIFYPFFFYPLNPRKSAFYSYLY